MQNVADSLQYAFQMSGGSVGFSGLYLAGIIALWYNKFSSRKEAGYLFWYAVLYTVLVLNPLSLYVVSHYLVKLGVDNYYLWSIPTAPVIMYVVVLNLNLIKTWVHRLYFLVGASALLLLAATTSYSPSEHPEITNDSYIASEELEVYESLTAYLDIMEKDRLLLWGDNGIMADARKVDGRFYTLYGRDLWEGRADAELTQVYEPAYGNLFQMMQQPSTYEVQIVVEAINRHCDVLVFKTEDFVKEGQAAPGSLEEVFLLWQQTKEYLIYVR